MKAVTQVDVENASVVLLPVEHASVVLLPATPPNTTFRATLICLALAGAIDYADRFALGGLFLPLQRAFGASPEHISQLFLVQNLALAAFSPVWGSFADARRFPRHRLLAVAAITWGLLTAVSACLTQLWQLIVLRGLTGAALAALIPTVQSMIADMASEHRRGRLYGLVGAASWIGAVVGTVGATTVGDADLSPFPMAGYALVLLVLGVVSILIGVLTWFVAADPNRSPPSRGGGGGVSDCTRGLRRHVLCVPTFLLLTAQGLANSVADRSVSTFQTLWLQNVGFSDGLASLITASTLLGCALGAACGGALGDAAAARLPASGRVRVAQAGMCLCALAWVVAFFALGDVHRGGGLVVVCFVGGALGAVYTPATYATQAPHPASHTRTHPTVYTPATCAPRKPPIQPLTFP